MNTPGSLSIVVQVSPLLAAIKGARSQTADSVACCQLSTPHAAAPNSRDAARKQYYVSAAVMRAMHPSVVVDSRLHCVPSSSPGAKGCHDAQRCEHQPTLAINAILLSITCGSSCSASQHPSYLATRSHWLAGPSPAPHPCQRAERRSLGTMNEKEVRLQQA